jgi:hypothetical protein
MVTHFGSQEEIPPENACFLVVLQKDKKLPTKEKEPKKQKTFIRKSNLRTPISSHSSSTNNYDLQSLNHQAHHLQFRILLFFFFLHLSLQIFGVIAAVVVVVAAVQSENHSSFIQAS